MLFQWAVRVVSKVVSTQKTRKTPSKKKAWKVVACSENNRQFGWNTGQSLQRFTPLSSKVMAKGKTVRMWQETGLKSSAGSDFIRPSAQCQGIWRALGPSPDDGKPRKVSSREAMWKETCFRTLGIGTGEENELYEKKLETERLISRLWN